MSSTSLTNFRDQYLTRAKTRLTAIDLATADDNALIVAAAVLRSYDTVNRFDAITPEAVAPLESMTSAELTAYLLDASNRQSFEQVLSSPEAMKALALSNNAVATIAASSTAMTAVAASSTAWATVQANTTAFATVVASSTAMTAVAASSTAMTAVAASNVASDAVFTNSPARLAIYGNDTALSAYQANPAQVQRQISARGVTASASSSSFTYVANGTKVILLRCWFSSTESMRLRWGRGFTADDDASGVRLPTGENLSTGSAAIGRTTTYANSGTFPSSNNDNANIVCAANGLRRGTWDWGNTQNVIYITV